MEDAMLIHRIMRAPEKRIFKIDIGNIPPDEVDTYMSDIITKMKKTPYIDPATGDYNLKFNMQNLLEDFFLPVRGGDTGTEIDTLSGMTFDTIEDIEYIKDRMMAALTIPKAFLGFTESIEGKATLAALDLRFARTIERIQRMVLSTLNEIAIIHLYAQGYKDEELVNFELDLTNPSLIYEEEKLAI
ncbi:MAG: portal protein [Actinobacteria bacterium]|nr:portal protein [Actinomycetota bacterium]